MILQPVKASKSKKDRKKKKEEELEDAQKEMEMMTLNEGTDEIISTNNKHEASKGVKKGGDLASDDEIEATVVQPKTKSKKKDKKVILIECTIHMIFPFISNSGDVYLM